MRKCYYLFTVLMAVMFLLKVQPVTAQCSVQFNAGEGMTMLNRISDNGLYAVGQEAMYSGLFWNLVTNENTILSSDSDAEPADGSSGEAAVFLWDVTNSGVAVGSKLALPITWNNGTWNYLPLPEGFLRGDIFSVTPDGQKMVGWVSDGNKKPCIWENGIPRILKEINLDDTGRKTQYTQAERISKDGSVITGFVRSYSGQYGLGVVWCAPDYEPIELFIDSVSDTNWGYYNIMEVSPNGKWLAGLCALPDKDDVNSLINCGYRYNLESKKFDVITGVVIDAGLGDGGPTAVDDKGTVYLTTIPQGGNPWARTAYVSEIDKPVQKLEDYLKGYGYTYFSDKLALSGGVTGVTPDGMNLVGHGASLDEDEQFDYWGYLIRLDGGASDIAQTEQARGLGCYVAEKALHLVGNPSQVEIVDMAGCTVYRSVTNSSIISLAGFTNGIYAVRLLDGENVKTQKVIIK